MTSINLYFADWCHFCNDFKPTWEKVKAWCRENNIKAKEYEDSKIQAMQADPSKNNSGVPLEMIEGYPTIIIKRGAGDFTKVGDRGEENILKMLGKKDVSNSPENSIAQKGGSCNGNSCSIKKQTGGSCEGEICGNKKQQLNHFGGSLHTIQKQTGGSTCGGLDCSNVVRSAEFYKAKYLTYKNKYLALKQELHL
jgi:hypothetical protein